jgi:hypothetical protein
MAYLVDAPGDHCRGYIMTEAMAGRTKHPRRIEPDDIIRHWRAQPTVAQVRAEKRKLPVAP